jgi:hypothetical protein
MSQAPDGQFWLVVVSDEKTMDQKPGCSMPAPKAKATFNGVPLKRLTGMVPGEAAYNRDCVIEFGFPGGWLAGAPRGKEAVEPGGPIPAAARSKGPAVLRIEDHSGKWVLEIPDAFTQRALTLESPPGGTIRRGQTVVLRRLPASDVVSITPAAVRLRSTATSADASLTIKDGVEIQGNRITVNVPRDVPRPFDGAVVLELLNEVRPAWGPCPVRKCEVSINHFNTASLTVRLES